MTGFNSDLTVAGVHRTIRTLAEDEGPFEGDLVTRTGGMAVRVDAERLRGWAGWTFAGAEHVVAPVDIALRADGQDVLLPWCVRTVRTSLAQATEAGGISHGEAVTLAVSILRGVLELDGGQHDAELDRRHSRADGAGDERHGSWWLTDEARPVFAIDAPGGRHEEGAPRETGERLLRDVEERIEDRALRRVLARLAEALHDPRRLRAEAARWEGELLEIAAPRPLRLITDEFAAGDGEGAGPVLPRYERRPRRRELRAAGRIDVVSPGRTGAPRGDAKRRSPRARAAPRAEQREGRRATGGRLATGGPARVPRSVLVHARRYGRGSSALRLRVPDRSSGPQLERPPRRRRWRGPVVVAVSAVVAITMTGALWPSDTSGADAAGRSSPTAEILPSGSGSPSPAESGSAAGGGGAAPTGSDRPSAPGASSRSDPAAAGADLIAAVRTCEASPRPACAEVWDGGAAASRPVRPAPEPAELIEDYGDIAAIRNGSDDQAQMIVIIRRNAEWRIRDVYDIANPPSGGAGAP